MTQRFRIYTQDSRYATSTVSVISPLLPSVVLPSLSFLPLHLHLLCFCLCLLIPYFVSFLIPSFPFICSSPCQLLSLSSHFVAHLLSVFLLFRNLCFFSYISSFSSVSLLNCAIYSFAYKFPVILVSISSLLLIFGKL